jgi:hypothetical protein
MFSLRCDWYIKKCTYLKCMIWQHTHTHTRTSKWNHHNQHSEHINHLKIFLLPLKLLPPTPPHSPPDNCSFTFCHYKLFLHLLQFSVNVLIMHWPLSHSRIHLQFIHIVVCMSNCHPFYCQVAFRYMAIPHFVYPFTFWRAFGLFPIFDHCK